VASGLARRQKPGEPMMMFSWMAVSCCSSVCTAACLGCDSHSTLSAASLLPRLYVSVQRHMLSQWNQVTIQHELITAGLCHWDEAAGHFINCD
jgi:hypothetical protein